MRRGELNMNNSVQDWNDTLDSATIHFMEYAKQTRESGDIATKDRQRHNKEGRIGCPQQAGR